MNNYHIQDKILVEEPYDQQDQNLDNIDEQSIFKQEISLLIWVRKRVNTIQDQYLVKYKNKSYLHLDWLIESEMELYGKSIKNKINRFQKTIQQKLIDGFYDEELIEQEIYFDPSYVQVDRILWSTEMFPMIHHKKANQIKGKWSQSLMIVCSKLLNFTKNNIHYSILFSEPVNPERDNCPQYLKIVKQPMDLGSIMNKIYLDIYKSYPQFWHDIGLVWKNCLKFNTSSNSDLRILALTLKQCSIFLYDQWFHFMEERYQEVKKSFQNTIQKSQVEEIEANGKNQIEIKGQQQLNFDCNRDKDEKKQQIQDLIQIKQNIEMVPQNIDNKPQNIGIRVQNIQIDYENNSIKPQNIEIKPQITQLKQKKIQVNIQNLEIRSQNIQLQSQKMAQKLQNNPQKIQIIEQNIEIKSFKMDEEQQQQQNFSQNQNLNNQLQNSKFSQQFINPIESQNLYQNQQNNQQPQYLNMQQYYLKNIFLTDKQVQPPTTFEQLELLNPRKYNYQWLIDSQQNIQTEHNFLQHTYEYIDQQDMKNLNLNVEISKLYLIKWKNLSYTESTWQQQNKFNNPQKINQFKNINKALNRQTRAAMQQQRQRHKTLVEIQLNPKKRNKYSNNQLHEIKNKLYSYDVSFRKQPHQYKIDNIPIYKNCKLLRPYQLESLNWLIKCWYEKRNTILADQMGLGKTIQSIAFLYHLYTVENVRGPFLVIAPLTTLQHWKRTIQQWTSMNCVLYYDQNGQSGRVNIQYYEWYHANITMKGHYMQSELNKFQIIVTSYEVFLLDFYQFIIYLPIQFIIVDQAHRLKNKNAKILSILKRVPCKRILLLTGTPIQNNTTQLWSLLNYIHPQRFNSMTEFSQNFGDLSSDDQVNKLNKTLKPYMLRRMKQDVEQSIPPLQQTIIDVEMTNIQKTIYRALYEKNKQMLTKGLASSCTYNTNLNNLQIQLRKCCNHPFLIKQMQIDLLKDCKTMDDVIKKLLDTSGKMVLVKMLLEKCRKQGKKALIFSQFTHMLQLIQKFIKFYDYKYEKIDGQVKAKERQSAIDRYNNENKNRDVFLLSTKAGGVGINLTSANVVIIYDSDWNPQNDVQATARAHRIGQKNQVQVYRLVTSNTYQTQMFQRATRKLGLDKAIFIGGHFKQTGENKNQSKISKGEMQTLLKKGILGFFENGDTNDANPYFEGPVQEIIEKNSRIAKYSLINGSCSFSKSRFISSSADNELKINDPNFWNIVLKNVESPSQLLLKKIKNLENYKTSQTQKNIMIQASQLVNTIIQNKLSLNGFNADDEINISEFLTTINSERQFSKYYRDMASSWLQQIFKPSRRFKKIIINDNNNNSNNSNNTGIKNRINSHKKVHTRSNEDDNIFDEISQEQQQQQDISQEKLRNVQLKKQQHLKRLCFLCQKPKCIYFCKSFCKRSFHKQCLKQIQQGINNLQEIIGKLEINQLCLQDQILKNLASIDWTCQDCLTNQIQCFICKIKGAYYGAEYVKNKKNKGKKQIQSQEYINNKKKKNQVTKCSTANCAKYFHAKCIENYDVKKLFKYIDTNLLHFRCSLHYCNICGISGDTMSILQCVRCPKALHIRCMDKQRVIKLSKKHFICDLHFKNKKQVKRISQKYSFTSIKKKLKMNKLDKKQKQKQQHSEQEEQHLSIQNQINHNYSTRRNKINTPQEDQYYRQNSLKKYIIKEKAVLLTYEEIGILPIKQFDYENYDKDWCRYCGSRYSSNFTQGPWGSKTLCTVHYISWKQSKTLNLNGYSEKPTKPINPDCDQQLKFITSFATKHQDLSYESIIEALENKKTMKK